LPTGGQCDHRAAKRSIGTNPNSSLDAMPSAPGTRPIRGYPDYMLQGPVIGKLQFSPSTSVFCALLRQIWNWDRRGMRRAHRMHPLDPLQTSGNAPNSVRLYMVDRSHVEKTPIVLSRG
jgi:hypothetical protein